MIEAQKYDDRFFDLLEKNSYSSAQRVLPIVNGFIHPQSIIDVGCGSGVWLKVVSEELHIQDYQGVEGPYVKPETLKVPADKVLFKDLKQPLSLGRRYDLAISMEVGEHLPDSCARQFVGTLTSLSDVVLFSAAIPGQEGTYHINEQYPEYWAQLFVEQGYVPVDIMRPLLWKKEGVEYWYQQNTLLYVKKEALSRYPALQQTAEITNPQYLTRIHPALLDKKTRHINLTRSTWGFLNWKWYMFKRKYLKKNAD
ncbi:hypothetical protein SAMN04488505_102424 [Chitinophaga rupis]|uniref:Methyltransferase domain-containing protein n=1 Tax=Chitinophaga rupis TaxID=573321 RepID=A0A1H7QSC2_9BACT|nr:methyltransferase domain-containing protein [Chitinophaga rupis]SEL50525.1 hypothetical protein SAMN04488505_102424 [Chitinophaga rupis]